MNIEKMSDKQLISTYRSFIFAHHELTAAASSYATINIAGLGRIITSNHKTKKKEYEQKNRKNIIYLSEKIRAMKQEIEYRKLDVNWIEDIKDDPLDDWYFQRMSKKDLLAIIDYLNEKQDMKIESSGTIEDLIKRLKEYIPKNRRREIIFEILDKLEDNKLQEK